MAKTKSLGDLLALELGYKSKKELRERLERRGETFAGGVKGRLEEGAGFGEAFKGSFKEQVENVKETFSKEGLKKLGKKAYRTTFKGDDIFSAYMRGRLRKAEKKETGDEESPEEKTSSITKIGGESDSFIKVIAKESMAIPSMARDVNVMRQNLQKLVKLWGGTPATKKEQTGEIKGKLVAEPESDIQTKNVVSESAEEQKKDVDFFAEQDKIEAEQEAAKTKSVEKTTSPTPEKKEEKKEGLLDTIISMFSSGFMKALQFILNPKNLLKVFSKVFLPVVIIGSLFSGIMDGFKKYQETGSFSEAIISGLGGMLKFLTFGIFGEETIRNLFDSISSFLDPITSTISNIFTSIKDFFVKLFGGTVDVKDESKKEADKVKPSDSKISEFASKPGEGGKTGEAGTAGEAGKGGKDGTTGEAGQAGKTGTITSESVVDKSDKITPKAETQDFATTSPKPSPMTSAESTKFEPVSKTTQEEQKVVEKISGTKIKLPSGVRYDNLTRSMVYNGIYFTAHAQEDLDRMVKAIDEKASIEFQGKDESGKNVTIKFDGATGSQFITEGKPETSPTAVGESSPTGGSAADVSAAGGGGAGGAGGAGGGGSVSSTPSGESSSGDALGGESPTGSVSSSTSSPSGEEISSASSDVSEGQRMESSADQGSMINAPTTNKSMSSPTKEKPRSPSVYDDDLINLLNRA